MVRWFKIIVCLGLISSGLTGMNGCNQDALEREALRDKLDAEFEGETEEVIKQSIELTEIISKLQKNHEVMDLNHNTLEYELKGVKLSPEDEAIQKKHELWDETHIKIIKEADKLVERFNSARAKHQEMEKNHAEVPLDKVREDHEKFEMELKGYAKSFKKMVQKMKKAEKQMQVIFKEHETLAKKYKVK